MSCRTVCFRGVRHSKTCWIFVNPFSFTQRTVLHSRFSTIHVESTKDEKDSTPKVEKYAYGKTGFERRNKEAEGLFYLKTVHLPDQLERNLKQYFKKFPKKVVENDGRKLARHLKNRGRPTDQTWQKYRESRRQRNLQAETEVNPEDILKLELQERGSIFDNKTDEVSDGEEDEFDDQTESMNHRHQQEIKGDIGETDIKETSLRTGINDDENDLGGEDNTRQNVKTMKKPKRAEYKVVRYNKRESTAYAASRIPSSYGATLRVFHEMTRREPDFKPETMLDFGSGTGMALWAAHQKWGDSIREYQCVDVSQDMIDLARYLLKGEKGSEDSLHIPRVYFKRFLPVSNLITYDVVVASYALSEIPKTSLRQMAVRSLWGKTRDFLVIIEHGNSEGFEITSDARSLVLKEGGCTSLESDTSGNQEQEFLDPLAEKMDEGFVFSPCPHDVECARSDPETRDHPCNFEQRVQLAFCQKNTRLKKFGFHTERFSYIVLRKGERDITEKQWPRVLQPIRLRSRHVICKLCCSSGDLEQKILTKKKDGDIYKCARHLAKWGDLLPDPEDRQRPVKSKLNRVKEVSSY
ncbi:ribosome assembly protein METTL17, mitochondrial-like [Montipora capricornis]|uniref:ribosome assembly protein METTL17, mitochondrial-like n=1 Tax=Montipora capricornis TaxID=246305 RepID=UPI0035F11527